MNERKIPYQRMIFVCTNVREGAAACGNAERGEACGFKLVEKLREEVKKQGLKNKIRVAKSGCMDLCARGPNIMVFDETGTYQIFSGVSPDDLPALAERFIASLSN